jgi:prolyl oligopeptidase
LPNGAELYAYFVRHYTTTNETPEQVHEIGLKEVARINAEMQQVMQQTGFKGSRQEFFKFLRTDPQFFYKTPEELFEAYKAIAKTVDPNLVKIFRTLPRQPYGVEAIPTTFAADTTTAYYRAGAPDGSRAGTYFVNLYKPDTRPKWEMMALTLHESVPGHHLQIARAQEMGEMPKFRRFAGYTAFVEGWGLYAESLGDDMGLYDDPYSKFGQLTYEMWRAVRLVVDTGIHAKHWTREQAIQYFMENAPKHELDITNEIDRYIAWPGQALAYKTGELKIKELRERSRHELGDKFDIKEFHDVVLGSGSLPLDILERNVTNWIADKRSHAAPGGN